MGAKATLYIPDRIDEGYGPNVPAMQALAAAHDLIVCVDCGTLSHEPIAAAGADVVVLDHHLGAETLPAGLCRGEPQPSGRNRRSGASVRGGRGVPDAGRGQPATCAPRGCRARSDGPARSGGAGHRGRCRAAGRRQPRLCAAGPEGHGPARTGGVCGRWPMWRGWIRPPPPMRWAFCLAPGSMPAGASDRPIWARGCWPPTTPPRPPALAARLDELNAERREITERVREEALAQAEARGLDGPLVWAAGRGLASRRGRHRRGAAERGDPARPW
jgi:single-stranded-DNA-specific exonuclease